MAARFELFTPLVPLDTLDHGVNVKVRAGRFAGFRVVG